MVMTDSCYGGVVGKTKVDQVYRFFRQGRNEIVFRRAVEVDNPAIAAFAEIIGLA